MTASLQRPPLLQLRQLRKRKCREAQSLTQLLHSSLCSLSLEANIKYKNFVNIASHFCQSERLI